jgi:hypothetical protein
VDRDFIKCVHDEDDGLGDHEGVCKGYSDLLSASGTDNPSKWRFLCLTEGSAQPVLTRLNLSGDILETRCHKQEQRYSDHAFGHDSEDRTTDELPKDGYQNGSTGQVT